MVKIIHQMVYKKESCEAATTWRIRIEEKCYSSELGSLLQRVNPGNGIRSTAFEAIIDHQELESLAYVVMV